MNGVFRLVLSIPALVICTASAVAAPVTGLDKQMPQQELLQQLISLVVNNNPTLASQESTVEQARAIPEPRGTSAITGVNLSVGVVNNSSAPQLSNYAPTANVGVTFTLSDPARALNILSVANRKAQARELVEKTRSDLIAQLLQSVDQILKLESQLTSQSNLKSYLDGYAALVESQVKKGIVEPGQLLPLKERLATLDVDLQNTRNQLATVKLETAMNLAGGKWREMLQLLGQLREFP